MGDASRTLQPASNSHNGDRDKVVQPKFSAESKGVVRLDSCGMMNECMNARLLTSDLGDNQEKSAQDSQSEIWPQDRHDIQVL